MIDFPLFAVFFFSFEYTDVVRWQEKVEHIVTRVTVVIVEIELDGSYGYDIS